jgi:hypothetical protein
LATPDEIPVTKPEEIMTVAADTFPLDHTPPGVVEESVPVLPIHIVVGPVIGAGVVFTVTVPVIEHCVALALKVIVAVPALTPYIAPFPEPIVAMAVFELDHVPEIPAVLYNCPIFPSHTTVLPVNATGRPFTQMLTTL